MDKWEKVVLLHRTLKASKYCIPLKTIMAELECSEATLQRREEFFASAYGIFTGPATKSAVIDFVGSSAREVAHEQWHPKQAGKWLDDKTYRLTVPYGHSRELIMDILRWGEWAEVKEPRELREKVAKAIKRAIKKYEK